MSTCEQSSQRTTWPPRAAVRQLSIALITFIWPRLTWPALARRQAGPLVAEDVRDLQNWTGHDRRGYAGGSSLGSSFLDLNGARRSNGLMTARMVLVAMRV